MLFTIIIKTFIVNALGLYNQEYNLKAVCGISVIKNKIYYPNYPNLNSKIN
jgi:hypothetical protein